ncbi:MAG: hypothetical protein AB8B62_18855 [Roseobacter sp.]
MLKKIAWIAVVALSLMGTAASSAVLYDCTITKKKQGVDWISEKVGIVLQDDGTAIVSDAVILHFKRKPLTATSVRNTERRLDVRWTVRDAADSSEQKIGHFDYHARLNKKTGAFALYAKPDEYPNRFSGKGSCQIKTAG